MNIPENVTYDEADDVWHNDVLLNRSLKAHRKDPAKAAMEYHAAMTLWIEENVCGNCGEYVGPTECYCHSVFDR